ncbi:antigen 5 like allergen Cul n 1-like [Eupeodes corollae]|uniref:antigen 5 like allergen Cul n 1-like n=1 Tax=Eupeodes corollae TaxID=290404 RepID=UPI00248F628B|nr:antigen 5 like allergen Cul n 1-like [Eupeodes corollae]
MPTVLLEMLRVSFVSILTLWWVVAEISATTDYCSPELCLKGRHHIGCNNTGTFSPECPQGETKMVPMTNALKNAILHSHNSKRQLIASGGLKGFMSAAKMKCMQWDDELARLAALNIMTCKFGHDVCRNTFKYKQSGQNLAKFWWRGENYPAEEIIPSRVDQWWFEYKKTNMSQMLAYPRYTPEMIGHFTVMTSDINSKLGCAAIEFPSDGMNSLTLACNYAATNLIGMPMYTIGPPASKCLSGTSKEYPCLCL